MSNKKHMKLWYVILCCLVVAVLFSSKLGTTGHDRVLAENNICISTANCAGHYTNGFCNDCNGYEPATITTGKYEFDNNAETLDVVYEISNAGQLYWLSEKINNEYHLYDSVNAVLTQDIVINNNVLINDEYGNLVLNGDGSNFKEWFPIGQKYTDNETVVEKPYKGVFDGNNFSISGLYINDIDIDNVGFIGLAEGNGNSNLGVRNLSIINSYIKANNCVGAIVGNMGGGFSVEKCSNKNIVVEGNSCVGGITGRCTGVINNCYNLGDIKGIEKVGGIVGQVSSGRVENSFTLGHIYASSNVGAVIGEIENDSTGVLNCFYLENIASDDDGAVDGVGSGFNVANEEEFATPKTDDSFKNGEIAFLLNNAISSEDVAWGQNIDLAGSHELYPVLGGDIVYKIYNCDGATFLSYSNTNTVTPHIYSYTATNNVITKTCNRCLHTETITIKAAENLAYDRTRKPVIVQSSDENETSSYTITYKGKQNDKTNYNSSDAPIFAGEYSATLSVENVQAKVDFKILRAVIDYPIYKSKFYNGRHQVADINPDSLYTIDNLGGIDVGSYEVKCKIIDANNYIWHGVDESLLDEENSLNGGDNEEVDYSVLILQFDILKATNAWSSMSEENEYIIGNSPSAISTLGQVTVEYKQKDAGDEEYTDILPTSEGYYFVRFTVGETSNYTGLSYSKLINFVSADTDDSSDEYIGGDEMSPKNTPKGLSPGVIILIVTCCVITSIGIVVGLYYLLLSRKIKKINKRGNDGKR